MMRWLWLGGACLVGAMALLPLRVLMAAGDTGLAARHVSGSVWAGQLHDAAWRGIALGDIAVDLAPLSLLTGAPQLAFAGPALAGIASGAGVTGLSGSIDARGQTLLPIGRITFENLEIAFQNGSCRAASGGVTVTPTGLVDAAMGGELRGLARCDAGKLLLPLTSATAGMQVRIGADGGWQALISVAAGDAATRSALLVSGFAPTPQGLSRRLEGHL
jgi:general secretion pathway protein N